MVGEAAMRNRTPVCAAVAVALLVVAGFLVYLPRRTPAVTLTAALTAVPLELSGWHGAPGVPDDAVALDRSVRQQLARTYQNGSSTVWVVVGYYPDQTADSRPPAQRLVYPARGWTGIETRPLSVPLPGPDDSQVSATQVFMRNRDLRLAVLYWYQLGSRNVAGDHWYRLRLLYNRLVHNRADVALVRIASPVPPGIDDDTVTAAQMTFVQLFYPELVRRLPLTLATARPGDSR
jgi:EpsI family protein